MIRSGHQVGVARRTEDPESGMTPHHIVVTPYHIVVNGHWIQMPRRWRTLSMANNRIIVDGELYSGPSPSRVTSVDQTRDQEEEEDVRGQATGAEKEDSEEGKKKGDLAPNGVTPETQQSDLEKEAEESRVKCVVCMERDKCILLKQCRHVCLCEQCVAQIGSSGSAECPVCRGTNSSWIRVFL